MINYFLLKPTPDEKLPFTFVCGTGRYYYTSLIYSPRFFSSLSKLKTFVNRVNSYNKMYRRSVKTKEELELFVDKPEGLEIYENYFVKSVNLLTNKFSSIVNLKIIMEADKKKFKCIEKVIISETEKENDNFTS